MSEVQEFGDKPLVVMGVGVKGIGKSGVLGALASEFNPEALHVTYQNVRTMLATEDEMFKAQTGVQQRDRMNRAIDTMTEEYLRGQGSIVLDIGNTQPNTRKRNSGYYRSLDIGMSGIVAVHFCVDDDQMLVDQQTSAYDKMLMTNTLKRLKEFPPHCSEGFDKVITVSMSSNEPRIVNTETPY